MGISCCYFPTTPMLVDDDPDFIKGTSAYFANCPAPVTYVNPKNAIDFINNEYKSQINSEKWMNEKVKESESFAKHEQASLDIDIAAIHQLIYNPKRFNEIAVIFADHSMPQITGIEFFRHLSNAHLQKILLTGQATKSEGLNAFNAHAIDQFIEKGEHMRVVL